MVVPSSCHAIKDFLLYHVYRCTLAWRQNCQVNNLAVHLIHILLLPYCSGKINTHLIHSLHGWEVNSIDFGGITIDNVQFIQTLIKQLWNTFSSVNQDNIVVCQVHPALVKIPSRVTRFCVVVHLLYRTKGLQGPCLVGAAAAGFTGDPAPLARDKTLNHGISIWLVDSAELPCSKGTILSRATDPSLRANGRGSW